MDLFDRVFTPMLFPETEISETSPYELLRQSFWDAWSQLWLPDYLVDPLDIWPHEFEHCEKCTLWKFLVDDILISSLIYFRRQAEVETVDLSFLLAHSILEGSYSDYSRNVKQKLPPIIKKLFGITQEKPNGPYQIKTPYPNLVAALIGGVGKSPLSLRQNTRNSLTQSLEFSKMCLSCIASAQNQPSYPAEERYIFERLFSLQAKIGLFHLRLENEEYPQSQLDLIRYMPNVTSRLGFAQALLPFPEPNHDPKEERFASGWLKVIGGYLFPAWQALFCARIQFKFQNHRIEDLISAIEALACYGPNQIRLEQLEKFISPKDIYKRDVKEHYVAFAAPWDIDWWALSEKAMDSSKISNDLLMGKNPLLDDDFLLDCLA